MGGLTIQRDQPPPGPVVADRRLFLTRDESRVVEDGDPAGAFLFATAGTPLSAEDVAKYGLTVTDGVIVLPGAEPTPEPAAAPEPEPEPAPVAPKAKPAPAKTSKAKTPKRKA